MNDYVRLVSRLRGDGFTRFYVLAQSMGGLDALELLDYIRPVAWAGIYPACNLRSIYVRPGEQVAGYGVIGPFAEDIRAAYGSSLALVLATESPVTPHNVKGLPMIFWSSPGDTVVPKISNTALCAADARRAGAHVQVVTTTGNHGDPSNFQPARLLAFYARAPIN